MKSYRVAAGTDWKVLSGTSRSQAALLNIPPGGSEGGADNRHPRSDQWLLVMSGSGTAVVNKKKVELKPGLLLLIEKNESHQIMNTGRKKKLKTLNFYAPTAY